MRRFAAKLSLFVAIHLAFVAFALVHYTKQFPPAQSFYASSLDKNRLLRTRPSPRLIFVGGSSMALGMDTALVARPLGFEPINMGLNMAVGLEFMLDQVKPFLRPGDVVILAPELHTFQTHLRAHSEYVARLIECDPSLIRSLDFKYIKELLDSGYVSHMGKILRTIIGRSRSEALWDGIVTVYNSREAFNENGDVIAHHGVQIRRGGHLRFVLTSAEKADEAIGLLNRFHEHCRTRDVRVFFSHAPYERKTFDLYRSSIDALEAMLKQKLTIPMLDSAEDMTFPSEDIFDVEYHLNLAGKLRHSEMVRERLSKVLGSPPR